MQLKVVAVQEKWIEKEGKVEKRKWTCIGLLFCDRFVIRKQRQGQGSQKQRRGCRKKLSPKGELQNLLTSTTTFEEEGVRPTEAILGNSLA